MPFPLLTPDPAENRVETGCDFPLATPVLAPGSAASAETAVDINVFHCVHGYSNELLLRDRKGTWCRTDRDAKTLYWLFYGERLPQTNPQQH